MYRNTAGMEKKAQQPKCSLGLPYVAWAYHIPGIDTSQSSG